jgi:uncharacterized protein YjgD (DUF1641 family)
MSEIIAKDLQVLSQKIDLLSTQVEQQNKRLAAFDEFKEDAIPIANHLFRLSINELAEVGNNFQLEDLLFLLKRVLRDTHLIIRMFDYLEAAMGVAEEVELLGQQVFNDAVQKLDELENAGYFTFARGSMTIMDKVIAEFDEQDMEAIANSVAVVADITRNLTKSETLTMASDATKALNQPAEDISMLGLMRELADPKVRKGLVRTLNVLKSLSN